MASRFQFRRAYASAWTAANPTLAAGELGFELDTTKFKIGNGTTAWNSLSYATASPDGITSAGTESLTNKTINLGSNTLTGTLAQFNTALSDQDFASLAGTETLSSKTLTSPTLTTPNIGSGGFGIAGSSSGTTTIVTAAAASGTVLIPAGAGTVATLAGHEALSNKTLTAGTISFTAGGITTSTGTVSGTVISGGSIAATGNATVGGSLTITSTVSASGLAGSLLSSATPLANSAGSVGASAIPSRQDHSHPTTGLVVATSPTLMANFSRSGALTTGTGSFRWYNDTGSALTINTVRASVGTAPTGASIIVDVNVDGTTAYSTQANRPTIGTSAFTGTAGSKSITTINNASYFTVDIDQVGSTIAGSDLVVSISLSYS